MGAYLLLIGALLAAPARGNFVSDLEGRSLRYFFDHAHPVTGLVRDRAPNFDGTPARSPRMASLAATGFGLAVVAHSARRGGIRRGAALIWSRRVLRFVSKALFHHRGWLYHFVDWETGERYGESEVSTVDTAWFLAGALYAAQVLNDPEVTALVEALYERVDFPALMAADRTLSMGWTPEQGYLPWKWDSYAEHMVLLLLGLGHPTRPLPGEAWDAWDRLEEPTPSGEKVMGGGLPLFVHQYSHLFVDFRGLDDGYPNYFRNSRLATLQDRRLCARDNRYRTYRAGFWGLSAGGSADGYQAFSPANHDGTVCPGCAGASAIFLPGPVLRDLEAWARGPYGPRIWGKYGFIDSLNLDRGWFDPDALGITVGALYLALANLGPRTIWRDFHRIPAVRRALVRAFPGVVLHRNGQLDSESPPTRE